MSWVEALKNGSGSFVSFCKKSELRLAVKCVLFLVLSFVAAIPNSFAQCSAIFQTKKTSSGTVVSRTEVDFQGDWKFLSDEEQVSQHADPIDRILMRVTGENPDSRLKPLLSEDATAVMKEQKAVHDAEKVIDVRDLNNGQIFSYEDAGFFSDGSYYKIAKEISDARDAKDWKRVVETYRKAPDEVRANSTIRLQVAMALNRQAGVESTPSLRYEAIEMIFEVVRRGENNPQLPQANLGFWEHHSV